MPLRVSKAEYTAALGQKANLTEVSHSISELQNSLESRIPLLELQAQIDEKVTRSDVQYLLSNKASIEEVRSLLDGKASVRDLESEVKSLQISVEEVSRDIARRLARFPDEITQLSSQLSEKVSIQEFEDALQTKANKQTVANALHRKASRSDLEAVLARKADISDVQSIMTTLETKAEQAWVEQLAYQVEDKVDRADLHSQLMPELSQKLDRKDYEALQDLVLGTKKDLDRQLSATVIELQSYIGNVKGEVDHFKGTLTGALSKKAENKELDKMLSLINKKADLESTREMLQQSKGEVVDAISSFKGDFKTDRSRLEGFVIEKAKETENTARKVEDELIRLREQLIGVVEDRRKDIEDQSRLVKTLNSSLKAEIKTAFMNSREELDRLAGQVSDAQSRKVDRGELIELKSSLISGLDSKADLSELEQSLGNFSADLANTLQELKEEQRGKVSRVEADLFKQIDRKVNISDFNVALNEKADSSYVSRLMTNRVSADEVTALRREVEIAKDELSLKASQEELDSHIISTRGALEEVGKDMLLKTNIKDLCSLLDLKANIDDVNKILLEVQKEIDLKMPSEDCASHFTQQDNVIEALCSVNSVGRWLWKSGEVKGGHAVPWEVQSVNTAPGNFLWELEKTSILTVTPGLYELSFGFYARKKPTIQLLVNGEPVLSAVNSASYVIHHSAGRLKQSSHSAGNITGLTLLDFISLPARARVSISYSGELGGEGFMSLRKL
jgi:DNA repair exonuclease SbcCD ATPase subunit